MNLILNDWNNYCCLLGFQWGFCTFIGYLSCMIELNLIFKKSVYNVSAVVEDIYKRRQPLPSMDAIYFIQPTKEKYWILISFFWLPYIFQSFRSLAFIGVYFYVANYFLSILHLEHFFFGFIDQENKISLIKRARIGRIQEVYQKINNLPKDIVLFIYITRNYMSAPKINAGSVSCLWFFF